MTDLRSFFSELKRRNVYKVAAAYAVVGWLVIQISSTVLPTFHAPEWVLQTLVVLVAVGFPIALVIAWAFELTPEGIKRTEDVDPCESISVCATATKIYLDICRDRWSRALSWFVFHWTLHRSDDHQCGWHRIAR